MRAPSTRSSPSSSGTPRVGSIRATSWCSSCRSDRGSQGADLADALGVSAQQSYGLLHRMRDRTERSLGALCVARAGRKECPELAEILQSWDGEFSVLIRKRVARHIDGCDTCRADETALRPAGAARLGQGDGRPDRPPRPRPRSDRVGQRRDSVVRVHAPGWLPDRGAAGSTVGGVARPDGDRGARSWAAVTAYVIADGDQPDVIATVDGAPAVTDGDARSDRSHGRRSGGHGRADHDRRRLTRRRAPPADTDDDVGDDGRRSRRRPGPTESTTTTIAVASAAVVPPLGRTPSIVGRPDAACPRQPTTTDADRATATATTDHDDQPTDDDDPTAAPGTLTLDTTTVDLGASARSRTVTLSNQRWPAGDVRRERRRTVRRDASRRCPRSRPVDAAHRLGRPFAARRGGLDRATATLVPVEAGVASASMNLLAIVERPPVVVVDGPPSAGYCPRVNTITVSVRATGDRRVAAVAGRACAPPSPAASGSRR